MLHMNYNRNRTEHYLHERKITRNVNFKKKKKEKQKFKSKPKVKIIKNK